MLIAVKNTWDLHGLRVVFGRVRGGGLVQQSYDRDLWFVTFSVAGSTQSAILCQQEAKEFRRCGDSKGREGNGRQALQSGETESKDRNYFKSSIPQGTGYESKTVWYVPPYACLFLQTKPNERQQKLLFYFLTANFLEFLIPVSL